MNTQDILHQAQDVFDRVTHRTSPLLPTRMEQFQSDASSGGSSSVLTNVAPPSALPSFLASPLPSITPPSSLPPSSHIPPPGPPPYSPSGAVGPIVTTAPSHGPVPSGPIHPPGPIPPAGPGPSLGRVPSPVSISPSLPPAPSPSASAPSPPSSVPDVAVPAIGHLPAPQAGQTQPFIPVAGPATPAPPVTSQPQLCERRNCVSLSTKGHSRHHSYPLYVPGNPMHNPPPPPTPPCLVVQQEQTTISKSYSQLSSYPGSGSVESLNDYTAESLGRNTSQMEYVDSNMSYSYSYPSFSQGSVDASASVDLGSPSVAAMEAQGKKGWFGWIRGTVSNVGYRVAEKAKTSMDTMITTLDPQMKEFIHSGGDLDILVASNKEVKVGAVREAFQYVFGKATVSGMDAQAEGIAAQPVGYEAVLQSAEERINSLRSSGRVHPQQPIVAVENFIVELMPDCWYDLGLLLLDDPGEDILLQTYTQVTPIPLNYVTEAQASTPDDYPFKNTGFATTVGQIASRSLQVHHTLWQETLAGVPRRDMVVLAARTLAGLYKARLPRSLQ